MLSKFERYPLTFGPTPIEKLSRLTAHLGGDVEIFAKREDCNSGLAFGGNKLRKLEYIVPDAISSNADTLVSIGGVQSNHTRMVAAVAAKIGMKCRLIQESWVPHEDAVYDRVGNIMQQDLVGYLQERDSNFEILNLPAIAPTGGLIPTGPHYLDAYHRSSGELLHPDHEPEEVLLNLKKGMGSMSFLAQYQQAPVSAEGTFIKSKWLKSYSEIAFGPKDQIVMSWDIALSEAETGDYSAGVVLLNRGETFYVLEVARGRFRFPQLIEKIVDMCRRYRGALLIEQSPISKGLIQALQNHNVNVVTVTPDKDKRSRVIAQSDLFEGGSIFIPERAEWRELFVRELLDFPGGRHDDQVDALVQGLAYQRGQWLRRIVVRPTTGY